MPKVSSLEELNQLRKQALRKREAKVTTGRVQITVFMGTCGISAGAREAMKAILNVIETEGLPGILVKQTGCIGLCEQEPLIDVEIIDQPKVRYGHVSAERAEQIMHEHVIGSQAVEALAIPIDQR